MKRRRFALDVRPGAVALLAGLYFLLPLRWCARLALAVAVLELGHVAALVLCGTEIYGLRMEACGLALRCGPGQVLTARRWRRDDRLALAESRGARSVKRLLAERGVTPEKRETIPVLCVDGEAAAVWGVGTDRSFLPEVSGENIYYIIMGEN